MNDNEHMPCGTAEETCQLPEVEQSEWVLGAKDDKSKLKEDRLVIGEPKGTFYVKPRVAKQTGRVHRNDWVADIAHIGDLLVMGTSMRGPAHFERHKVCQDSFAIDEHSNSEGCKWVIAAIADGVSAAPNAHFIADYMVRQAIVVIGEALNDCVSLHDLDWEGISKRLADISLEFCRAGTRQDASIDIDKLTPAKYATNWATTLEFAVVQATDENATAKKELVHVAVAGDGAAYIMSKSAGWKNIKAGKEKSGSLASPAVSALPLPPEFFIVNKGYLNKNECLILTTDGLGDFIGDGSSVLGGFFQERLTKCRGLASFLQVVDVSLYQADDDRTIIMVKELKKKP
jgi:serine/threonine protein phosphatase PrpC